MHKLNKKQRKALRANAKLSRAPKLREHRQRISDIMCKHKDYAAPRYYWSYKW